MPRLISPTSAPWCNWLTRQLVTLKTAGSTPAALTIIRHISTILLLSSCSHPHPPQLVGTIHTTYSWHCLHTVYSPGYNFGVGGRYSFSSQCADRRCIQEITKYGKDLFEDEIISLIPVEDSKCL